MSRLFLHVLCISVWLLAFEAVAFDPSSATRDGVLVLHNGGIVRGQIARAGDRYLVILGDHGEIRVPVRDVEMYCLDMEEVYQRKLSRVKASDVGAQLDLAEWCLQHQLFSFAADQLLKAIALQPDNPRLPGLERRLQLAVAQPPATNRTAKLQTLSVGLVDLERTTRSLPEGALEDFTAQVQPLLLNRCGANSCHGNAGTSDFRLVRPMWSKTISRRFTQRNLYAVMQQLHAEDPESSPLLRVPSSTHGGMETVLFGPREQEQFELLVNWVRKATAPPSVPRPETIEFAPTGLLQASYSQPVELPRPVPEEDGTSSANPPNASSGPAIPPSMTQSGFVPRDPFDAEIFNRRRQVDPEAR